jgi:hypothetical protein
MVPRRRRVCWNVTMRAATILGVTCLATLAVLAPLTGARANVNLLTNGSFENLTGATVATTSVKAVGSLYGWTIGGTFGTGPGLGPELVVTNGITPGPYDASGFPADPFTYGPDAAGTHAVYFVDDGAHETLAQSVSLAAGTRYEVGFDLFQTNSGYHNAGGFTLTATLGGAVITTATGTNLAAGTWFHFAELYTPTTSGPANFVFNYVSSSGVSKDVLVDQVYVETPPTTPGLVNIDEPPAAMLLFAGLATLMVRRRRR